MDNEKKEQAAELRREARIKIIKIASVFIAGAIILACYSYTRVEQTAMQMFLYLFASFICVISGLFIIGAISLGHAEKNRHNFFLYDRKSRSDIPLSSLTVTGIREKLLEFMSIFKRRGKLYVGDLFAENPNIPEHFKPLFCYEILYELAAEDGYMDAKAFLGFGGECADIFTKYLRENEDYELATKLRAFILDFPKENNAESFKEYMKSKKEHIEEKMLKYTVKNIEKFN